MSNMPCCACCLPLRRMVQAGRVVRTLLAVHELERLGAITPLSSAKWHVIAIKVRQYTSVCLL